MDAKDLFLKVFIYILQILKAALRIPIVLSFALFIAVMPMFFQGNFTNPLFRFLPEGSYTTADILFFYGKLAFGFSLILTFAGLLFKQHRRINTQKKAIWLGLFVFMGYCLVLIFLVVKAEMRIWNTIIALTPFLTFSLLAIFLNTLLSVLINFLDKAITAEPKGNKESAP